MLLINRVIIMMMNLVLSVFGFGLTASAKDLTPEPSQQVADYQFFNLINRVWNAVCSFFSCEEDCELRWRTEEGSSWKDRDLQALWTHPSEPAWDEDGH